MIIGAIVLLIITLAYATVMDLRYRRIPNRLTFPMLLGGLILRFVVEGQKGVVVGLEGAGIALAVMITPFAMNWLGAGDVKLTLVVGALMGPDFVVTALLFAALVGGIIAIAEIVRQRQLVATLRYLLSPFLSLLSWYIPSSKALAVKARLPYAPAIAGGCVVALVATTLNAFRWF